MINKFFMTIVIVAALNILGASSACAVITGPCSDCHTMHNSQDNLPMRYDTENTPLPQLLRRNCYGCHAQGLFQALVPIGVDVIPQVYHQDSSKGSFLASDLAGGNFAYIDGVKGSPGGAADAKGHNIVGLWSITADAALYAPPGGIVQAFHNNGVNINTNILRCDGTNGCHGNRYYTAQYEGINRAHHNNASGAVSQGAADMEPGHGYRFLLGVNGYEDSDWQYTKSSDDHNEYFGRPSPVQLGCTSAASCHGDGGVRPPNGTMAEYCGTCHGNFHTLSTGSSSGIGPDTVSPFIRHPSDLSIPGTGEYAFFTTYLTETPVARINPVIGSPSSTVTPGTDAVFCLSCHVAHGSPYPDLLKWDYTTMEVGQGTVIKTGCFACHRNK